MNGRVTVTGCVPLVLTVCEPSRQVASAISVAQVAMGVPHTVEDPERDCQKDGRYKGNGARPVATQPQFRKSLARTTTPALRAVHRSGS